MACRWEVVIWRLQGVVQPSNTSMNLPRFGRTCCKTVPRGLLRGVAVDISTGILRRRKGLDRRLDKVSLSRYLYVASRESADGTEFQIVILFLAMNSANLAGKMAVVSGMMTTVAPALNATKRSKTDMSK